MLAVKFAFVLVFLRISMLHQLTTRLLHVNLYLLYIVGPAAILLAFMSGAVRRNLEHRATICWLAFAAWMFLAIPFSSFRSGSLGTWITYIRSELPVMFVLGTLLTWGEFRQLAWVLAAAAGINLATANLLQQDIGGRLALDFGTVSNPNDFAAHILLALPFLLWIVLGSKSIVLRFIALGGVGYGVYVILSTGSRGAAVALAIDLSIFFWRATAAQRFFALLATPIALIVLLSVVPKDLLVRIRSFTASENASEEALESSQARGYLLGKSVEYTLKYPVFGVGPEQFANFEGTHNKYLGGHGYWHGTHNSVTQASSEMGILAALFMLGGAFSTFGIFGRIFKQARGRPECQDIRVLAFCWSLASIGFFTAILFLNFAYFFYLPMLAGAAVAMKRAADAEFKLRPSAVPPLFPAPAGAAR
jgi:hypothetical protein